jgi:hypothetical protein
MKKLVSGMVLGGLLALVPVAPGFAEVDQVSCNADPAALGLAIAGATAGDTLVVEGTCLGTVTIDKDLTLEGSGNATLDGNGSGPVVAVRSGVTATLEKLTVTGGVGSGPVAIGGIDNEGDLTLRKTTVSGNTATASGSLPMGSNVFNAAVGGIDNDGGTLTLDQSHVTGNTANAGADAPSPGGNIDALATSAIVNFFGTLTLNKSEVSNNTATASTTAAATDVVATSQTMVNFGGTLVIDKTTVSGNTVDSSGGSNAGGFANAALVNVLGPMTITNSKFSNNSATTNNGDAAAAISSVIGSTDSTITDSDIRGNQAASTGGVAVGGVEVVFGDGSLTLEGTLVKQNRAESDFVAVGGVNNFTEDLLLTIVDSKVEQNTAQSTGFPAVGGVNSFDPGLGGFDPTNISLIRSQVKNNTPTNCEFVDPACA